MRILHVTDFYLPRLGGIESHVAALARAQVGRGDQVTVLTGTRATADHWSDDPPRHDGVRVCRASYVGPLPVDLDDFDVVHGHVSVISTFAAPIVARTARRGLPTVVTVHSLWGGLGPIPGLSVALAQLRGAPVLWAAVSEVARTQLAAQLPSRARIEVLPNAVAVAPRDRTPPSRAQVRLVSTMRLARRKRPLQLLRMMADLRETARTPVSLTVVGDGPMRDDVARFVRRRGLADAVRITGRVAPEKVLDHVAAADVYVAPARLESFGLAALEARGIGLPVVGYASSGITEFVRHGHEGLLGASDADLVDALARLVDDHDLRHRISEHNRLTPSGLTWDRSLHLHDAAYCAAASLADSTAPVRTGLGLRATSEW